jgi:ATP-binding cassette subfamily B protein
MAKEKLKAKKGTLKKALKYIGKYKFLLPLSLLFAVITVVLTLAIPLIIGEAINLIVGKGDVEIARICDLLIFAIILIGLTALSQWIMSAINNKIAYGVVRDLRNDAFTKLQSLPLFVTDNQAHGDIVNRVINDTDRFSEGLLLGFTQVFTGVLTIVGTLVFMLLINWQIALVVVFLTPLSIFIARFIGKRTYTMFKARSEAEAETSSVVNEMIGNRKLVRAFGYESRAQEKFDNAAKKLEKSTLSAIFISSLTNPTTRFVNALVYASVALVGAFTVTSSGGVALTVGALSSVLSYATQYAKPFNEISGVVSELQNALACAERTFALINEEPEIPDNENAITLSSVEGNVSLNDVSFSYTENQRLIENLCLDVKKGQRIAIVGPTGCGKTTLINLLMRFYDVKSGAISVDDNDIRGITRASLRESYGMVLQETWIRNASIRDNIAIGKPDATNEEIIEAAKKSHAHNFIKRLPNGYDTIVSEDSSLLSQGQKQLLCIARIMLCLPPMLILDEATSSIDTRTELTIQDAFAQMMRGRTSFIVAHRLSTIREADVILVMNKGQIIEQGTHDELLARGGFCCSLYNSQFEAQE